MGDFRVLTTFSQSRSYFENWSAHEVDALEEAQCVEVFGGEQRITRLTSHLKKARECGVEVVVQSRETTRTARQIMRKLGLSELLHRIVGADDEECASPKLLILRLLRDREMVNDGLLYVSADMELCSHFKDINLCAIYEPDAGIDARDMDKLQRMFEYDGD